MGCSLSKEGSKLLGYIKNNKINQIDKEEDLTSPIKCEESGIQHLATPLWIASFYGQIDIIKYLLSLDPKPELEWKNDFQETPLLAALKNDQLEAFELLKDNGANIDAVAIVITQEFDHNYQVKEEILEEYSAKIYAELYCFRATKYYFNNEEKLFAHAVKGETSEVLRLIDMGVEYKKRLDDWKYTPGQAAYKAGHRELSIALNVKRSLYELKLNHNNNKFLNSIYNNKVDEVRILLDMCHEDANQTNECGYTGLMIAAAKQHVQCIILLISYDANVELTTRANENLEKICDIFEVQDSWELIKKLIAEREKLTSNYNIRHNSILFNHGKRNALTSIKEETKQDICDSNGIINNNTP